MSTASNTPAIEDIIDAAKPNKMGKASPSKTILAIMALLKDLPSQVKDLQSEAGQVRSKYGRNAGTVYTGGTKGVSKQADIWEITLPSDASDKLRLTVKLASALLSNGQPRAMKTFATLLEDVTRWEAIKAAK